MSEKLKALMKQAEEILQYHEPFEALAAVLFERDEAQATLAEKDQRIAALEQLILQAAKETRNEMFGEDGWASFTPECLPGLIGWLWTDRQMCVNRWSAAEKKLAEVERAKKAAEGT